MQGARSGHDAVSAAAPRVDAIVDVVGVSSTPLHTIVANLVAGSRGEHRLACSLDGSPAQLDL